MYCAGSVAISDGHFRASVIGGGIALVLGITAIRFCGSVPLPPRSPRGAAPAHAEVSGTSSDPLAASASFPAMYQDLLARDAAAAGLPKPTIEEMSRKLPYRVDEGRRVLEVGQRPIEIAGLRIAAVQAGDALGLEIRNESRVALAYLVVTQPTPPVDCSAARPLPVNAMVIGAQQRETRVECVWREGVAIEVSRIETMELPPLSARYVSQVPPSVVGIEDRIARGHHIDGAGERCSSIVPQALKNGLERGEIGWRDLIDFYARHRCQTYQFPVTYRAFTRNGAMRLPVGDAGG
jgi:hypothetical protein